MTEPAPLFALHDERFARLARYVTNTDRNVFALRNLPEEVAAVLFAYYSRSPDGLRENLLKLMEEGDLEMADAAQSAAPPLAQAQEKARAFHEKWVVGYGHGSVAEHAVVKLAVENVSILASKLIEDCRLASFTEKSTRYVRFDATRMYYPESIMQSALAGSYRDCIERLMDAYAAWMEPFYQEIKARTPQGEKQTPRGYETALRATVYDILRYLLPAATHTNIGITVNARSLETMITKLLSHPLPEARALGGEVKREATLEVPTLLKYADPSEYREGQYRQTQPVCAETASQNRAKIIGPYLNEEQVLALTAMPADAANPAEFSLDSLLGGRGRHDPAPRCLERVSLTFEITMDYGAFRDVQRHRMAMFDTDPFAPCFGYEIPPQVTEFGYEDDYRTLMQMTQQTFEQLSAAGFGPEAAYVLPLAWRVRTRMTANLRELFHFIELRTGRGGHPSYRKIALQVYEEVARVYPKVAEYIRPNKGAFALTRE